MKSSVWAMSRRVVVMLALLAPAAAAQLGIGEMALLIVRPDGHVGLRADRDHLSALAAYQSLLARGSSFRSP